MCDDFMYKDESEGETEWLDNPDNVMTAALVINYCISSLFLATMYEV